MSKVIALPARCLRPTKPRAVPARILLFTGVRYVRDVEPADATPHRAAAAQAAAAERLQA